MKKIRLLLLLLCFCLVLPFLVACANPDKDDDDDDWLFIYDDLTRETAADSSIGLTPTVIPLAVRR